MHAREFLLALFVPFSWALGFVIAKAVARRVPPAATDEYPFCDRGSGAGLVRTDSPKLPERSFLDRTGGLYDSIWPDLYRPFYD